MGLTNDQRRIMFNIWNRIYRLWQLAGLAKKPKLHATMHMCERARFQGNPTFYATWTDESLNKLLGILGRQAHRTVWEARILANFQQTYERAQKTPRR